MIESIKNLLKDLCSYVAIAAAVTLFSVDRATTEVINYFIFQVFICIIDVFKSTSSIRSDKFSLYIQLSFNIEGKYNKYFETKLSKYTLGGRTNVKINSSFRKWSIQPAFWNYTNLRLVSAIFYQIFVFSSTDSPSKTMKNVFYFV